MIQVFLETLWQLPGCGPNRELPDYLPWFSAHLIVTGTSWPERFVSTDLDQFGSVPGGYLLRQTSFEDTLPQSDQFIKIEHDMPNVRPLLIPSTALVAALIGFFFWQGNGNDVVPEGFARGNGRI